MAESPKLIYCGHCEKYLTKTVYYKHKRLYYDKTKKEWLPSRVFSQTPNEDSTFHPTSVDSMDSSSSETEIGLTNFSPLSQGTLAMMITTFPSTVISLHLVCALVCVVCIHDLYDVFTRDVCIVCGDVCAVCTYVCVWCVYEQVGGNRSCAPLSPVT